MNNGATTQNGVPVRVWIGALIALIVVVFIVMNRNETEISFIFLRATTPLWVALALSAGGGFLAGVLFGRRRYK